MGSDGFEKVLIGTRGARETFLRGRKGRAAKNSVVTSGAKQLKCCGAKLTMEKVRIGMTDSTFFMCREVEVRSTANNYATSLLDRHRYAEARSLLHRTIPVAQRVLGASNEFTLKMRGCHADSLCWDPSATLSELREAVTEFEDLARDARRVFGSAHPFVVGPIGRSLQNARAVLRARETPPGDAV